MNKWMKMFFTYLDRFYVKYHGLPSLEDSGTKHFKNIIYEALKTSVAQALLTVINDERENIVIDRSLIKSIVELFESMGMGTIDVYQSDLEVPLLESTRYVCIYDIIYSFLMLILLLHRIFVIYMIFITE